MPGIWRSLKGSAGTNRDHDHESDGRQVRADPHDARDRQRITSDSEGQSRENDPEEVGIALDVLAGIVDEPAAWTRLYA